MILSAVLVVNIALDAVLVRFGANGLAAAFSITMCAGALALAVRLSKRVPFVAPMDLGRLLPAVLAAAAGLAGAAWLAQGALDRLLGHASLAASAAVLVGAVSAGAVAYMGVLAVARVPEIRGLFGGRET